MHVYVGVIQYIGRIVNMYLHAKTYLNSLIRLRIKDIFNKDNGRKDMPQRGYL